MRNHEHRGLRVLTAAAMLLMVTAITAPLHASEVMLYGGLAKSPVPLYENTDSDWYGPLFGITFSGSADPSPLHVGLDVRYHGIKDVRETIFGDSEYRYSMLSIAPIIKLRSSDSSHPTVPVLEMSISAGALRYGIDFVSGTLNDGEPGEDEARWYPIIRPGAAFKFPISSSARLSIGIDGTFFFDHPDDRMPADHTEIMAGIEFSL